MVGYDNSNRTSSGKIKWNREDVASIVVTFESTRKDTSQRQFAKKTIWPVHLYSTGFHGRNLLMPHRS